MKPGDIYNGLKWPTRKINMSFKIKVNGILNGKKITTLVGVSGLINLIGIDLTNKLIDRAFKEGKDVCICKLRRGLVIRFYLYYYGSSKGISIIASGGNKI